ncbi:MAG TPA: recombinase family protein, partial [Dehalococcoidia bacterium]|nr:recombinase family protein [Dehalococcoidia bacterium]
LFLQHCKTKGWTPIQVYREEGRSAHSDSIRKRPVFRQLLEDAGQGQFDVVVVHTLDRWARNQRVMLESLSILAEHQVALASLSENIDYSTPHGRLFIQMLGGFAQYFSDSLATHVSKGLTQRAIQGRHVGGIPFGYASCWESQGAERKRLCNPEHPAEYTYWNPRPMPSKRCSASMPPAPPPWPNWPSGSTTRGSGPGTPRGYPDPVAC